MKYNILIIFGLFLSTVSSADTYVEGHYKNSGTYVQPHYRSDKNNTTNDNWSTKGNTNPYTEKRGTKKRSYWY